MLQVFKKGNSSCGLSWTVLKALSEVSQGTMSQVMIYKTRRVSGNGELIADTIAKGNMNNLLSLGVNLSLSVKPSRVLSDYVKKPNVDCMLSSALLEELSDYMPVVKCNYTGS